MSGLAQQRGHSIHTQQYGACAAGEACAMRACVLCSSAASATCAPSEVHLRMCGAVSGWHVSGLVLARLNLRLALAPLVLH
jgi:hypothetical protein